MDILALKKQVYEANMELIERGVVIYTWGNASGIDRERNLVVIKPSGVDYTKMTPEDMVEVDLLTGEAKPGQLKPSSDLLTHLELYKGCKDIGGVVHTHSVNAVAFAQAGKPIPAVGTTHADYFLYDIPCTRILTEEEVTGSYERNTGKVILETIEQHGIGFLEMPAVLVRNHGPFVWGKSPAEAVHHAVVLETVAEMAFKTLALNTAAGMEDYLREKHFYRKHGKDAYYGQS